MRIGTNFRNQLYILDVSELKSYSLKVLNPPADFIRDGFGIAAIDENNYVMYGGYHTNEVGDIVDIFPLCTHFRL